MSLQLPAPECSPSSPINDHRTAVALPLPLAHVRTWVASQDSEKPVVVVMLPDEQNAPEAVNDPT